MKKIKTNKKGIRVRAELSSIAGFGDRGFHDNGVKEVENIFISKEGLKLQIGDTVDAVIYRSGSQYRIELKLTEYKGD